MTNLRTILMFTSIVSLAVLLIDATTQAATLYEEYFTGQTGLGHTGPGTPSGLIQPDGVDWSIDVSGGYFTATSDWFRVDGINGDEMFTAHDPGGAAIWHSPTINIAGYTDLQLSIYVVTNSNDIAEGSNEWQILYSVDGGDNVEVFNADDVWGPDYSENDKIPNQIVTAALPEGSTLSVQVYTHTSSGVITLAWDDVIVTGVPEPATLSLLAVGGLLFMRRRR
jgi:hypothetical protein